MSRISTQIYQEEQVDSANTWTVTSGHYWDKAALAKANPLTSAPPRECRYYVSLITKSQAWPAEDISVASDLSDFSETLEDNFVSLRERAPVQGNIEEKVFEWSQHEATTIPDEIIQNYLISTPSRILRFCQDYLPIRRWGNNFLVKSLHKTPVKTEVGEKTEIVSEQMPHEVFREIERWGLKNQVFTTLRLIRETYSGWRMSNVSISSDPEIPERRRIRITITVSGTPEDVFQDELRFKERLYSTLDIKVCELITVTYNWET